MFEKLPETSDELFHQMLVNCLEALKLNNFLITMMPRGTVLMV